MNIPLVSKSVVVALLLILVVAGAALAVAACGDTESSSSKSPVPRASSSATPMLPAKTQGTLLFTHVSEPKHNYDVYRVRSDGTGLMRLTYGPGNEEHAYWSPDGTRIVYGANGVWVMNADGSGKVRVADGGSPSWSPDGKQILYDDGGVWVMNADGSGRRCVVGSPNEPPGLIEEPFPPRYATWAANGAIVFVRVRQTWAGWGAPPGGSDPYPGGDLFAVDPDGSGFARLTKHAGMILPSISPDGATIVACVPKKDRMVAVPWQGDGAAVTLLARASHYFPNGGKPIAQWTSDGRQLVLGSSNYGEDGGSGLYLVNLDGSGLTRIPGVTHAICPDWRPEPASSSPSAWVSPAPAVSP